MLIETARLMVPTRFSHTVHRQVPRHMKILSRGMVLEAEKTDKKKYFTNSMLGSKLCTTT